MFDINTWMGNFTSNLIADILVAITIGIIINNIVSNKEKRRSEENKKRAILLGSLKLLYSELSINKMNLESVKESLETMPQEVTSFFDNFALLEIVILRLKTQAFYGIISSGAMEEVTTKPDIFNPIQQAYFNMEFTISGFITSKIFFQDFKKNTAHISDDQRKQCLDHLKKVQGNITRIIKIIDRAEKITIEFLEKNGSKISIDSKIQNLK